MSSPIQSGSTNAGEHLDNAPQISSGCVLYVNDAPDRSDGHMHIYNLAQQVVAVSFVAGNGRAIRVNFDPQTGDVSTTELEEDKDRPAAPDLVSRVWTRLEDTHGAKELNGVVGVFDGAWRDGKPREVISRVLVAVAEEEGENRREPLDGDRLRTAGEFLFSALLYARCEHAEPRDPRNAGCEHCQRKGAAMDRWDEAIKPSPEVAG